MRPHEAAKIKPLVILFCFERFELLSVCLPRIINATRQIGGYLWAIDDASTDYRVQDLLRDCYRDGVIDWITLGKTNRFVDFVEGPKLGAARRTEVIRYLNKYKVPLAFLVESDMVIGKTLLEEMLWRGIEVLEVSPRVSGFCGAYGSADIFTRQRETVGLVEYRRFGPYFSQEVVLLPFFSVRRVAPQGIKEFSLNQYARKAFDKGLESVYLMHLEAQHLGVGIVGSSVNMIPLNFHNLCWTDASKGRLVEVSGFDVRRFIEIANTNIMAIQYFCYQDAKAQQIDAMQEVSPYFTTFLDNERRYEESLL